MACTLGAPVSVPAGKRGLEHVHAGHAGIQGAFYVADDVHHVAVALHDEGVRHLDRADFGNAADVVAGQVDQHHVLGALFGVVDQLDFGRLVQLGVAPRGRVPAKGRMVTLVLGLVAGGDLFLPHQESRATRPPRGSPRSCRSTCTGWGSGSAARGTG